MQPWYALRVVAQRHADIARFVAAERHARGLRKRKPARHRVGLILIGLGARLSQAGRVLAPETPVR